MSKQKEEQLKVSTLRKKEETRKNKETTKNTTAVIPMKSAKNDDYDYDSELHAQKVSLLKKLVVFFLV